MTQQEQQEFTDSLEAALSWMKAVQERLRANDNTQGPRDALEARLRETEKIHQSEYEGRVKMDAALVAAETLLQIDDEDVKTRTHIHLKDLKSLWEETCTYIIHCHSRIEWVWLHWSEYLKAREELEAWLARQRRGLDVGVELQVGLKEKLWQVDQQRVILSDIHSQGALLERLLDEAAALHNRTQDHSLDPQAQERLREAYNEVRDRAEERLALLQNISEEHQALQTHVQTFQAWLLSKTRDLTDLMEQDQAADTKLQALQVLDDSVACEEKTLQHIEGVADAVRTNTSPAGAESVQEEVEELRLGWQRLRQGLCEAEDGLRCSLDSHSQYLDRCRRLGDDIGRLRTLLRGLDQELEETQEDQETPEDQDTEEQMVDQWRKYTDVRRTLAVEESQVELLKSQLKELFRFSEDSRHLSDNVLAVVREHQSVKCRATRLCSESELGLRSVLQDPLLLYSQWTQAVTMVMQSSADVSDFSHIAALLHKIEVLLEDSAGLKERLGLLQVKGDLLDSVFGPERSDSLQGDLKDAVRNRELLQEQLQQRKSRLQALISRTKDFEDTYQLMCSKLAVFREHLLTLNVLQPDILAKKSQLDQLLVLQKDLEDFEAQIRVLETLVSCSQTNRSRFEKLSGDWKDLQRTVAVMAAQSKDAVGNHENFHSSLLSVQKWMMVMQQKLESFRDSSGCWSVEGRRHEAERALGEFPEKEQHLQQTEVQAQTVLNQTSVDGRVHILKDLEHLRTLWMSLYNTSLNLHRLLSGSTETDSGPADLEVDPSGMVQDNRPGSGSRASSSVGRGDLPSAGDTGGADMSEEDGGGPGTFSTWKKPEDPSSMGSRGSRWSQFDDWLSRQNRVLLGILRVQEVDLSEEEVQTRQEALQALRSGLSWGQDQFQLLLQESLSDPANTSSAEDVALEELRYRWMLYKSKLKDVGDVGARRRPISRTRAKRAAANQDQLSVTPKTQKRPSLVQRVCGLALLLWLLLLVLLLLVFLLPLMDDGHSCSLSNNFRRSFSVMLRYNGPPPT